MAVASLFAEQEKMEKIRFAGLKIVSLALHYIC
jgi:hypothetical protein